MNAIGFIGLGHMGQPMVRNLIKAGCAVYVYDVMPNAVKSAVSAGAVQAESIAFLAKNTDVILTSVQTGEQVREVCLRPEGIFSHFKAGKLYIDCSSIDIVTTRQLHAEAKKLNIAMLDAPVSGGVLGAEAGTLTFMVGGSQENFARALPLFQAMGKKIVHAGDAGSGQAAKICNNLLLGISMIGVCEAFSLAEKLGLAPKKFFEISASASGQCWALTSNCPAPDVVENVPANHDYEPGFMAKMMLKDLKLAHHAAASVEAALPLGTMTTELYESYVAQGFGEKDFSGIMNFIASK